MTEELEQQPLGVDEDIPADLPHHDLLDLFNELSFKEKFQKMMYGLGQPKDTGAYKWAKLQLIRMASPVSAVVVPCIFMLLLFAFAGMSRTAPREVEVRIMEPEPVEELEEIEDIEEPIEPPEPIEMEFSPDTPIDNTLPPMPNVDFSPQPADFDTVAIVKSPVVMRGVFGSRSPGQRGQALAAYGGSGITEAAVLRALRWLKKNQLPDGSWPQVKPAITGMALLAFLAHGETPSSEEFGETVEKAMKLLVEKQRDNGRFIGSDGHEYALPIATYALCEAYGLTKVPMLKYAAEKATAVIVKGQNATGSFNYNCKPGGSDRNDISYGGWCMQALKAAKMADLDVEGLDAACKRSIDGCKWHAAKGSTGGFAYSSPGTGPLTGVGVLCMQLLGAGKQPEAIAGLRYLENVTCRWETPYGKRPIYYWYYITQAKFHAGGATWDAWNNHFALEMVRQQIVEKNAIMGPDGEMKDIGHWVSPGDSEKYGNAYNTALCALQLQVYYRYLPTYKTPTDIEEQDFAQDDGDIKIEVDI